MAAHRAGEPVPQDSAEAGDEDSSVSAAEGIARSVLGLGAGSAPEARGNVERIRAGAERKSPALEAQGDPVLDYLLGGEGQ